MAVPVDACVRLAEAIAAGAMTHEAAKAALDDLDDGRPIEAVRAEHRAAQADFRARMNQISDAQIQERRRYIDGLTPEDLDRGET